MELRTTVVAGPSLLMEPKTLMCLVTDVAIVIVKLKHCYRVGLFMELSRH